MDPNKPQVHCIHHEMTGTNCFIVSCLSTKKAAVIDPVLDYDSISMRTSNEHSQSVLNYLTTFNLDLVLIIETHVHADHLTGSQFLKEKFPQAQTMIGRSVTLVQETFKQILNIKDLDTNGSQFDRLLSDNEEYSIGELKCRALYTPGHTPACVTHVIGDAIFSGDTIFLPDAGTARCDFPGGSAETLFDSIQKIFALPEEFRVFVGHDYGSAQRGRQWESTIWEEKSLNMRLNSSTSKEEFVGWRKERDSALALPKLIVQSIQVNLCNGKLPEPEDNGVIFLKMPVNAL